MIEASALSPWRGSSSLAAQLAQDRVFSNTSPMGSSGSSHDMEPRTISPSLLHSPRFTPISMRSPSSHSVGLANPRPCDEDDLVADAALADVRMPVNHPQIEATFDADDIGAECPSASSRQNIPAPSRNATPFAPHLSPCAIPALPGALSPTTTTAQPLNIISEGSDKVWRKRKRSLSPLQRPSNTTTRTLRPLPSRQSRRAGSQAHVTAVVLPASAIDIVDDGSELSDSDMDADGIDDDEYDPTLKDDEAARDDDYEPNGEPKRKRRRTDEEEQRETSSLNCAPSKSKLKPSAQPPMCAMRGTRASSGSKGEHACHWCGARFTRKYDLKRHQNDEKVQCAHCEEWFARPDSLQRHQSGGCAPPRAEKERSARPRTSGVRRRKGRADEESETKKQRRPRVVR